MRRLLFLTITLALACGGCQCSDEADGGWDIQNRNDTSPDAVSEDIESPCPAEVTAQTGFVQLRMRDGRSGGWFVPAVADGAVYFHRRVEAMGSPGIVEVARLEAATGEIDQLQRSQSEVAVVAASEDRLVVRSTDDEGQPLVQILDASGQQQHQRRLESPTHVLIPQTYDYVGAAHQFMTERRLLLQDSDGVLHLLTTDGVDIGSLDLGDERRHASRPVLTPAGVAFSAVSLSQGTTSADIFLYDVDLESEVRLTESDQSERYPWSDGEDLYWLADDGVWLRSGTSEPRRIQAGRCTPPHAAGGQAVFACSDEGVGGPNGQSVYGRRDVYLFDGEQTRPLPTASDDPFVFAVRVVGRGAAWIEYDGPDPFCYPDDEVGTMVYYDPANDEHLELGQVGGPCLCCSAMWPPLNVDVDGNLLAWNYAYPDDDDPEDVMGLGYALIQTSGACR
jgi:hypothetical protein